MHWLKMVWHHVIIDDSNHYDVDAMIKIDLTMIVMGNFHQSTMHWLKMVWHDVIISDNNHYDVDAMIAINVTMIVMINYHDSIR